mmetsp:Transcript_13108/g.20352  ORF Transcript_13108/g.20352 Transcript_13108/m.20352 type:complete len:144 (+) Transcript_13108:1265-1696(+)
MFREFVAQKVAVNGVSIVRIDPVYNNAKLIALLEQRGSAISTQNLKKVAELEASINAFKQDQYQTDIVGAFITFEREQDIKQARAILAKDDGPLSAYGIIPKRPEEPTDYNWKALHSSFLDQMARSAIVLMAGLTMLVVAFLV